MRGGPGGEQVEVCFQMSRHTNRVHVLGKDGDPLGLSLPLDLLLLPGLPASLLDILEALHAGCPSPALLASSCICYLSFKENAVEKRSRREMKRTKQTRVEHNRIVR